MAVEPLRLEVMNDQVDSDSDPPGYGVPLRVVGASYEEELLADLNPPQRVAATHHEGPLLVLAGAGSGKTRVLVHRIAWLVATGRAQPGEILAITFTNKAAGEMRDRVAQLTGPVSRLMWVMTFHAACARILRAHADRLGYKRTFTIYDDADSRRMVKRCAAELEIDPKRFSTRTLKSAISGAKNRLIDVEQYAAAQGSYFESTVAAVYRLYEERMPEANALDFDDLLVRTVNLLELFDDVRDGYQSQFAHLMVDEYQDTNRAQYRLLQLLAGERQNLFVVGDDFQSIYGFRHAEIRNILDFSDDFDCGEPVKLEQNYRSTKTILDASNALIANNSGQMEKRLWSDGEVGAPVVIAELDDEHEEARWVAGEIGRLIEDAEVERSEVAVFYRTNAQSRVLEDTLVRFDVPYQVIGGAKFYDRAEIKDALGYLSLLVNPEDTVAFARVVNSPRRGIGKTSEARILGFANLVGISPLQACERCQEIAALRPAARKAIGRFAETIASLGALADSEQSVAVLLEAVLNQSGYVEALEDERGVEAEGRLENLRELVNVAAEFDAGRVFEQSGEDEPIGPLEEFLQGLALLGEQDKLVDDAERLVTLMTIHNAKGLEYDVVFLIGCEEEVFPHARSLQEGNLEEERRLCYVGMTRARTHLYMSYARSRRNFGALGYNVPSRFVSELPSGLSERQVSQTRSTGWASGSGGGWGRGRSRPSGIFTASPTPPVAPASSTADPAAVAVNFALGDDIRHAKFGDGVVIGIEPGIVVVRFAEGGAEKKLMAEFAPITKIG